MAKIPEGTSHRAELILPYGVGELQLAQPRARFDDPLAPGQRLTRPAWKLVLKRVVSDFSNDAMVDRGATLTYYTVLSLAPLLLAAYSIVALVLPREEASVNALLRDLIGNYVPAELQQETLNLLLSIIGTPSQSTVALSASVVISLLSASAYVRSFARNANLVYGRTEGRNIVVTWTTMWIITLVMVVGACLLYTSDAADE